MPVETDGETVKAARHIMLTFGEEAEAVALRRAESLRAGRMEAAAEAWARIAEAIAALRGEPGWLAD